MREFGAVVPDVLVRIIEHCLAKVARRSVSPPRASWPIRSACGLHRLHDTESLVRESTRGLDCFIQGACDTFSRSSFRQPGDRYQEVIIEATEGKNNERPIFPCSPSAGQQNRPTSPLR